MIGETSPFQQRLRNRAFQEQQKKLLRIGAAYTLRDDRGIGEGYVAGYLTVAQPLGTTETLPHSTDRYRSDVIQGTFWALSQKDLGNVYNGDIFLLVDYICPTDESTHHMVEHDFYPLFLISSKFEGAGAPRHQVSNMKWVVPRLTEIGKEEEEEVG